MAVKKIILHPDLRLKKICDPVKVVDDEIIKLGNDLLETMYKFSGIGLAASQIGVLKRVFVMDCSKEEEKKTPYILINPEIVWISDELNLHEEGCLSIPDTYVEIERPKKVKIKFINEDGEENLEIFEGISATCAQHEIDHLDGKLSIDYLGPIKRRLITNKMKKAKKIKKLNG